jgi:hypothetical protein
VSLARSLRQPEFAAYLATTSLALVPIWITSVFPSQDGGAHLYNAHVLASLATRRSSHYAQIYSLNLGALANWTDHVLLALLTLVASPPTAEKLLVSLYVVTFAAAARYAATSIRSGQGWIAHLALPLIFTFSVQMGFYNFILCFPLYFVLLGYYRRHHGGHPAALTALFLALYVLHPVAWLFGVLSLSTIEVAEAGAAHASGQWSWRVAATRMLRVWLTATPGLIVLLVLVSNEPSDAAEWQPFLALLRHVYFGGPLWTFSPADTAFGAALFGLFAFATVAAHGRIRTALHARSWRSAAQHHQMPNALAWVTIAYLVLLLVLPSQWKSLGLITERVGTFAFLTWVLALAAQTFSDRMRTAVIVAAQVLALLLIARWTIAVRSLDPYVDEYLSLAPHIEPATRLLELNFATRGRGPGGERLSHPVAPFAHTIGLIGATRDAVVLNDYEALTAVFPLKHRFEAADLLRGTLHDPPEFTLDDLDQFERATCQPIDYVVVWQANAQDAHTRALLDELAGRYDLTYVSKPGGHAQVHARRGAPPCG